MSVSSLLGVGGGLIPLPPYTSAGPALTLNTASPSASLDAARERLRTASAALNFALDAFTNARPISPTATVLTTSIGATVGGLAARLDPFDGGGAFVHTTVAVNTQTSTSRSSATRLNLDLRSAASQLFSNALGLDVTSPDTASILRSAGRLGLDVSSAEAASIMRSAAAVGLDVTSAQRASSIASTGEMSTATTTSYGTGTLTFAGSSSHGQLTGTYTGVDKAADATALSVTVTRSAHLDDNHSTGVAFEVRNQTGKLLFDFDGKLKAGQQVYLGDDIGLSLTFSGGDLAKNATAGATITRTAVSVDADAKFNDLFSKRPQFDDGRRVSTGSFTINSTKIKVDATDTINTVLQRINASGAGVTASVSGDRITFATQGNSEDDIRLADDTSGFLAAVKLKDATATRGNIRDDQQVLAKTAQFGWIKSGSFTINKVAIAIDRNTDTLGSVLDRINTSSAGVTASYDAASDKVVLQTASASEDTIDVDKDTTGFLLATKLTSPQTLSSAVQSALDALKAYQGSGDGRDWQDAWDAIANAALKTTPEPTVRGNVRDDRQVLSKTAAFSTVTSGSFTINGAQIAVDRNTDSLATVIDRINASSAGVNATYDAASDAMVLTSRANGAAAIAVGNDSTGLLAATHLSSSNTVRGHLSEDRVALGTLSRFASVTNGSFDVDGRTIAVDRASDSLRSIATKINESGARVTARYDATRDMLVLQGTSDGEGAVPIGRDTSGFLAAAGLDPAKTVAGNLRDDQQALAGTAQFRSVKTGAFEVNGVSIVVDAQKDSLQTIVDKVNRSGAGVTATYRSVDGTLTFTSLPGATLSLEHDSSGFLAAAAVATGTTGARANADAAFDGTGADAPLLDAGTRVTAGSFTVNGVTIAVDAHDSPNAVLRRISASAAGVAAVYDDATQTVTLAARGGAKGTVTLGDDSSGFLRAVKLDATATRGRQSISAFDATLDQMGEYAGVRSGVLTINGTTIAIDPKTTTIRSLVSALNGIDNVSARLQEGTGALMLASRLGAGSLTLADSSGVLAALGLAAGTFNATPGGTRIVQVKVVEPSPAASAARVSAAVAQLNDVVSDISKSGETASALRGEITSAIASSVGALRHAGLGNLRLDDPQHTAPIVSELDGMLERLSLNVDALEHKPRPPAPVPSLPVGDMTPPAVAAAQALQSMLPPNAALKMQEADPTGAKAAATPGNEPTPMARTRRLSVVMSQVKEQLAVTQAQTAPKTRAPEPAASRPGTSGTKTGRAGLPRPTALDRLKKGSLTVEKEKTVDSAKRMEERTPLVELEERPLGRPGTHRGTRPPLRKRSA